MGFKNVTLKGQSNGTPPTIKCENNKPLEIHDTGTIVIEGLAITNTSFNYIENIFISNVFMQWIKIVSLASITISKSEFHVLEPSSDPAAVNLVSGKVLMQDVIISNKYGDGLYMDFTSSHSQLNNITVTVSTINGTGMILGNNADYISIAGIEIRGGTGLVAVDNGNHFSLRDAVIHLTENGAYTGTLLFNNGHHMSLHNISIFGGVGEVVKCGKALHISNVRVNSTSMPASAEHKGLLISNNGNHANLSNIKIIDGDLELAYNEDGLYISNIVITCTTRACNGSILPNGNKNKITISDVKVIELTISNNGDLITAKNVTVDKGIDIRSNGHNLTVIDTTLRGSKSNLLVMDNGNNITLINVTVINSGIGLFFQYNMYLINLINVTASDNMIGLYIEGRNHIQFINHPSTIMNNRSPSNGAGMWITKDVTMSSTTDVYFINNTVGGVGGAIYVDMVLNYNSLNAPREKCTFQNFRPKFIDNHAYIAGNDTYNGIYWNCETSREGYPPNQPSLTFLQAINCSNNSLLKPFPVPLSSHITSTPLGVCLCTSNKSTNCTTRRINRQLYPGQSISLPLVTVGVCGGISPGVLIVSKTSILEVSLMNENQETERDCKTFRYQLKQPTGNRNGKLLIKNKLVGGEDTNIYNESFLEVKINFSPCPNGFQLASKCQCNQVLEESKLVECDINWMPRPIRRSGSNWLYYSHDYNCTVAHKYCPFDYCNDSSLYLSLDEGDVQCANGRAGILCGGCQTGLSLMLGTNKCGICNDKYLGILAAFIVSGMLLTVFLLALNLTVSLGSINGLLVYANIVKLNQAIIFSNGFRVPVLSQFVSWLNLDFGIQTCFFNGLDGYWKTWLQFVFPLYIWLLIGFLIIGSHYSGRLSRLCGNNAVPVLATLVLMSYTKLLGTITNVLMRDTIDCEGTAVWSVWSVDGNIGYLSGKHIPLFVVAVLFLFIGLVYTGLVFSAQWLQRYSGKCCRSYRDPVVKLKPFIDAYTGPYKDKYRFWTGLFMIVRLILTPVFAYTTATVPQVNNYIIALVSFLAMYLSRSVYRSKVVNLLETFYLFNLGLLSLLSIFSNHMSLSTEATLFITTGSVSLCFIVFIGTVLGHVYTNMLRRKCQTCFTKKGSLTIEEQALNSEVNNDQEELHSPAPIVMKRDSVIYDFSIYDTNDMHQ